MTSHSSTCSPKSLANDQETWPKITGLAALSDDHFNGKNTNIGCIHNSCSIRDKAQRPSAFKSQPSGRLTCSTLELRAQFQPHQSTTKRKENHTCKACPHASTWFHDKMACLAVKLLKQQLKKRMLSRLPAM